MRGPLICVPPKNDPRSNLGQTSRCVPNAGDVDYRVGLNPFYRCLRPTLPTQKETVKRSLREKAERSDVDKNVLDCPRYRSYAVNDSFLWICE